MGRKTNEIKEKEEKIISKYKIYFDILFNSGGALYLNQFQFLTNKSYSQTSRDIKFIEENTNLIRTLVNDENYKICILTCAGWSIDKKNRKESSCSLKTLETNSLKTFMYINNIKNNQKTKSFLIKELDKLENNLLKNKDISKILNSKNLILGEIKYTKSNKFVIDILYVDKVISYRKLLESLELLYSILELITESNNFTINLDLMSINEVDKKSFFKYLYSYKLTLRGLENKKFKIIFYKNLNKKVDFYKIETNFDVYKYS